MEYSIGLMLSIGSFLSGDYMPMDPETKKAIMQLWDVSQGDKEKNNLKNLEKEIDKLDKTDPLSTAKFLAHVKLLEEQKIIRRVNRPYVQKDPKKNARLEALGDVCGVTMDAFLDPSRRNDNPMFDIQPITLEFLDRLELEHVRNSVWSM